MVTYLGLVLFGVVTVVLAIRAEQKRLAYRQFLRDRDRTRARLAKLIAADLNRSTSRRAA
jgi:heme exporter protein D